MSDKNKFKYENLNKAEEVINSLNESIKELKEKKGLSDEDFGRLKLSDSWEEILEILKKSNVELPNKESERDILASFPPIKHPEDVLFSTEAVNRDIFNWTKHGEKQTLKSTHNAYIYYGILFNDENVKIGAELNKLDEIVHRGLITLYASSDNKENLAFSLSTLYRTMVHNKDARLYENYHDKIVKSIEKMATTLVKIDVTDELEKTNYKKLDMKRPVITENLINMTMLEGYQHGAKTTLIKLNQPPILYDYANKKNQIARIPSVLLDIPKINMSENNLILVDYLAAQIQYMKKQNRNRHINYDNLYKQLGMLDGTKSEKNRIRNTVTKFIIPYWKKEGWIVDAKQRMKNRRINSLEIFL